MAGIWCCHKMFESVQMFLIYHNYWYAKMFILYVLMIFKQISRSNSCGWECVLGERSVWSVLSFVFDKKCVRLTSDREVGNRIVTDKVQVG